MGSVLKVIVIIVILVDLALSLDPNALLVFSRDQSLATVQQLKTKGTLGTLYPSNSVIVDGKSEWDTTKSGGWTSGFLPGTLWKLYNITKDDNLLSLAQILTEGLSSQQHNTGTHDVGFIIFSSFGSGYLITGNQSYHPVILTTSDSLATRYNPIVGCIRSWNGAHFQVIIDNMMNLELLWWSSLNGGNHTHFDMAASHADHMIRDCIKPDGSSYHLIDYDPDTGAVLSRTNTPQGYPNGVWSRGEAWALYGFTMSYRYSKFQRYLNTANLIASYLLAQFPSDFVYHWDFKAPPTLPQRDTSAAAIAASAFLELATYVPQNAKQYVQAAENILTSLATSSYLANPQTSDAVLLHGCEGYQAPCDVSLIYADYYFTEALVRYKFTQKEISP
jgi:hypothetical protein